MFWFDPLPSPFGNSSFGLHFPLKVLPLRPLPFGTLNTQYPSFGGYGYFLEPHNVIKKPQRQR